MLSFGLLNIIIQDSFISIITKEVFLSMLFALLYTIFCDESDDFYGKKYAGEGLTIRNLFENFYFSSVTMFSVGYGDISPLSDKTRFITLMNMFLVMYIIMIYFPGKYPYNKKK